MMNWLTKFHQAKADVAAVADYLEYLSDALRVTGNEKLAEDLHAGAKKLHIVYGYLNDAMGEVTQEMVDASRQSAVNMVQAALVVATREDKDEN